jgi:hypothetical protein
MIFSKKYINNLKKNLIPSFLPENPVKHWLEGMRLNSSSLPKILIPSLQNSS